MYTYYSRLTDGSSIIMAFRNQRAIPPVPPTGNDCGRSSSCSPQGRSYTNSHPRPLLPSHPRGLYDHCTIHPLGHQDGGDQIPMSPTLRAIFAPPRGQLRSHLRIGQGPPYRRHECHPGGFQTRSGLERRLGGGESAKTFFNENEFLW